MLIKFDWEPWTSPLRYIVINFVLPAPRIFFFKFTPSSQPKWGDQITMKEWSDQVGVKDFFDQNPKLFRREFFQIFIFFPLKIFVAKIKWVQYFWPPIFWPTREYSKVNQLNVLSQMQIWYHWKAHKKCYPMVC